MLIPIQTEINRLFRLVSKEERRTNEPLKKSTARLRTILKAIQRTLCLAARKQTRLEVRSC